MSNVRHLYLNKNVNKNRTRWTPHNDNPFEQTWQNNYFVNPTETTLFKNQMSEKTKIRANRLKELDTSQSWSCDDDSESKRLCSVTNTTDKQLTIPQSNNVSAGNNDNTDNVQNTIKQKQIIKDVSTSSKQTKIPTILSVVIIILRIVIFVCLVLWCKNQIQNSLQAAIHRYYTPLEEVEFEQYGISVTCKEFFWSSYSFYDGGFNYCVKPLVKIKNQSIISSCDKKKQKRNATHSFTQWRFIAEYTRLSNQYNPDGIFSNPDALYTGCSLFCAIASNSTCHVPPSDTTTHLLPISNIISPYYYSIEAIPYYPLQFTSHKFAPGTSSIETRSDEQCFYVSSIDGYFSNDPFCRSDLYCTGTNQCTPDCLNAEYMRFAMLSWKFNCTVDPWKEYFKGPSNEEIKSNPNLFYSACEDCPKPVLISFLSYMNEAFIGIGLVVYSMSKDSEDTDISYKKMIVCELKIYWSLAAIARAVIATFSNFYSISRAIKFGGWMGYQCLNHIGFGSSAFRIVSVQIAIFLFVQKGNLGKQSDFERILMIAKFIPITLIFLFYCSVMICGAITHIIVFELAYIWIIFIISAILVIPGAIVFGALHCCFDFEEEQITNIVITFISLVGLGAVFIYGVDVMIALYLGATYMKSLKFPLERSLSMWWHCSSYSVAFDKVTQIIIDII